ncbi:MAG: ATP-binding protein [Bacteroidota bacterium]
MIPAKDQTLKINSHTQSLRLVERLVEDVSQIYNLNEDCYGNMLIAVTEAVNNAIFHGNQNNPDKLIKIGFEVTEGQLIFSVTDEGPGFDFRSLPDPTDPNNIDKLNGRGVFLMTSLSDSIQFDNNGAKVSIGFNHHT